MRKTYAQIIDGRVHGLFSVPAGMDNFDPSLRMVDVTDMEPQPEPGWLYQPDKAPVFVPPEPEESPVIPEPEPVLKTRYTHREFVLRLGDDYAKLERLRDENNAKPPSEKNYDLARLFRLFDLSEWIGLDDPSLQQAMHAFVGLGLITQERAVEIMTPNQVE